MATFSQVDTANGLTQKAATVTTPYTVTRVAIGAGTVGSPATATALANQQIASVTLGAFTVINPGEFVVQVTISSASFSGTPFVMTEMGLFGTSGSGPEQLTTYYNVFNGPLIENNTTNPAQIIYLVLNTAIANASAVSVTIATGVYALESDFVTHLADPGAHPQAFINPFNLSTASKQGLILALDSVPTDYLGGDGQWHHLLQAITGPITLFVAPGNPNIYPNFSTIQNALNWLANYTIVSGVTVTISVAAATYTQTTPITVNHPNGDGISIIGTLGASTTITSAGSFSGSAGNWSVPFVVASASGLSVGQYVTVSNLTGSGQFPILEGVWQITAISGTTVTVRNTFAFSPFVSGVTVASGQMKALTTVIQANGCNGINVIGKGVGLLQNMLFSGNATDFYGIICGASSISSSLNNRLYPSSCVLDQIGVVGFGITATGPGGIMAAGAGSLVSVSSAFTCTCYQGLAAYEGGIINVFGQAVANCNIGYGVHATSASVFLTTTLGCGNGLGGLFMDGGGSGRVTTNSWFYNNQGPGIYGLNGVSMTLVNAASQANAVADVKAAIGSTINCATVTVGSFSPAANTLAADGSYIAA